MAYTAPSASVTAAVIPSNTAAPIISGGDNQVNFLWSASPGTWNGTPVIAYAYQWQDCNGKLSVCSDIASAEGSSYQLQTSDIGYRIRVRVTATNSAGPTIANAVSSLFYGSV